MKATVKSSSFLDDHRVTLETDFGTVSGVWDGSLPPIGQQVDIELDFDRIVSLGSPDRERFSLGDAGEDAIIVGKLEFPDQAFPQVRLGAHIIILEEGSVGKGTKEWALLRVTGLRFFNANI